MENDRIAKSKEMVDAMLATGANTILIASPEVDQAVEDILVARRVFAARISTEEIEHLSRYTGAKPVRVVEDLKRRDVLGNAEHIWEDEDNDIIDRKSTRLNSSHANISYAVFCLKKKKIKDQTINRTVLHPGPPRRAESFACITP